ncbi:Nck-associated protein 5 like protein [Argiope bruennichi]|uniref:Nck-associated protein 5 like protein n=1 Tax=Argiope bruennichi TaxID=94029 RepID=A0A8T0EKZ1_ARGBR|nr:Nck-associated protein 5 like protein [Argiope bruennichi]
MLQLEVKSLKEELQAGKLKLQSQQVRVRHLEEELGVMQQLRQELDKEKELRKIAEDKLLELLDYEKRMEVQKRDEKRMESRGTQVDSTETAPNPPSSEPGSPLLLGYDGRLRKYQTYIAKLENDNLMLVNELKKFKDMSPRSQEEQAKVLVEKLGQMERNNQQQQIQYETCLDEVANKLVQTLLAQKRLEEECKVLHLRVEQLEQENVTLMELMDKEKEEKTEKVDSMKSEQMNSYIQLRKPSHHPLTSSPVKKSSVTQKSSISSEEQKDPPKSTNLSPIKSVYSEPRSPVTSPTAKVGCASKIPSFSSSKPVLVRKKSETDMQPPRKSRNEALSRETSSSDLVPNSKPSSALPSLRNKPQSTPKGPKGSSAKRKRLSRTESPAEKGAKDSKQRIKSNHIRWDSRKVSSEEMTPSYSGKECVNQISPIPTFPQPQHVWSFNCELSTSMSVPEIKRKVAASIDALKLDMELGVDRPEDDLNSKQSSSTSESSTTIEGGNRTRDEGYSTMSSDLQPDSAADTTISEPEHSATYVITEKDICNSDDSVTECLDGSMCSSSDSGFGPLHQVATPRAANGFEEEPSRTINELPKFDAAGRKLGTVKCKEQIASVKPTIRSTGNVFDQNSMLSDNKSDSVCDKFLSDSGTLKHESSKAFQEFDRFSPSKLPNDQKLSGVDQSTMIDYINFPKEIMGLTNYRNSWHLAEKATLTEPEEELWREKALAPFIDESIWSLYSSEGDIQVKHFPIEPLLSEPSLEKLINNCSPCIVVTENVDSIPQDEAFQASAIKSSTNSSVTELNNLTGQNTEQFKPGLERVASDTVLYLKDAIHELEDSMRRGLKSSKNIPALHQNSGSESESSPTGGISFKPEILRTLESTMAGQDHLAWPSPTRSSSLSSVQSCVSCHVVSDEMEDVDLVRTSQKGSRDNDLNSASDAEYENLDHRDFVERWLQKEIVFNNSPKLTVSHLEPVAEIGEYPLPSVETRISPPSRTRFSPYPNESKETNAIISLLPIQKTDNISPTQSDVISSEPLFESDACVAECIPDCPEDVDVECLDPEATEFNGDFYTLCSIGSLKSLDRFSPSKTRDMTVKQLVESPIFNRKAPPKSLSKSSADKLKPTGLVKPTRPVSLSFVSVPSVPEHSLQKSSPTVTDPGSKESDCHAKTSICTKVPPNNFSVCQSDAENKKSPVSECSSSEKSPVSCLPVRIASVSVKPKSPTKIVFRSGSPSKSEDASKRQQWKRDRLVSRRSHLKEGCGTAWIHLQPNPALSDPSVRSNLLDSLKAPTSSSGSSGTEEEDNEVLVIQTNSHLHRICKERRHKAKASANNPLYDMKKRSSIVGRRELFYRFGDKEKEAIACFDFLEEIPSVESLNKPTTPPEETPPIPPSNLSLSCRQISSIKERISLVSPTIGDHSKSVATADPPSKMTDLAKSPFSNYSARKLRLPNLWNKPLSHNMSSSTLNSQDCELLDHISLSDSCAESYSSTPESYDDVS